MRYLSKFNVTRLELAALIVMVVCLFVSLVSLLHDSRGKTETAIAMERVQTLYQNEVLQFYSARQFFYSLTKPQSQTDFFTAKPPAGKAEPLDPYPGDTPTKGRANKGQAIATNASKGELPMYSAWNKVGFVLQGASYYLYRLEPEFAFAEVAKPGDKKNAYYHFRALAYGDVDGDGIYSIFSRGAYISKEGFLHGQDRLLSLAMEE